MDKINVCLKKKFITFKKIITWANSLPRQMTYIGEIGVTA